jgi:hypothetical protein
MWNVMQGHCPLSGKDRISDNPSHGKRVANIVL